MVIDPRARDNVENMRYALGFTLAAVAAAGCSPSSPHVGPPWLGDARVFVQGVGSTNMDCRNGICQHNENTDLTTYKGAIYLVHRTAMSQVLGPNSALHVYRSTDHGATFTQTALLPAPTDRDLRDPAFYQIGDTLFMKALTRLPVVSAHDSNVDTVAIGYSTTDGTNWNSLGPIGPHGWSFWRPQQQAGVWYSAAYQDGDASVVMFSSTDGIHWTQGASVYGVTADSPVETELVFFPSGRLLALVRCDSTGPIDQVLGDDGPLKTQACWANAPYTQFDCSNAIMGQRFDGPLAFFWKSRLFMVARKHLQPTDRKRTSLFELSGDFTTNAAPSVKEWGELPSAGDTSYAGQAMIDDHRVLVSWYSSDVQQDETWTLGLLDASDIWVGTIDLSALK
jgi:hypothetical protein